MNILHYTMCQKTGCLTLVHKFVNFQNSLTIRLGSKHVVKQPLKIPPHLKRIATLPCQEARADPGLVNGGPRGVGFGEGLSPSPTGEGLCPSPEIF